MYIIIAGGGKVGTQLARDLIEAFEEGDFVPPEKMPHLMVMLAKEGWFAGLRGKVREAIAACRGVGEDDFADTLTARLATEAAALADLQAWCEENGYTYGVEV